MKPFNPIGALRRLFVPRGFTARMKRVARELPRNGKRTAVLIGFSKWKTFMTEYLQDCNVVFFGHSPYVDPATFELIGEFPNPEVYVWSYKFPPELEGFCRARGLNLTYVEDGFLRSIGLGAERTKPLSLVFDRKAMHFDRKRCSELEELLVAADFRKDHELLLFAEKLEHLIVTGGLSKYLFPDATARIADLGLSAGKEKVLVIGQVEDDLSIRYGAERLWTGNQIVRLAKAENPRAEILYRPHPESIAFPKRHYSDPDEVATISNILGPEYAIRDCLAAADVVYTVTSLAGFEATFHGKRVVTVGRPFYSGWGFTDDRDSIGGRTRRLLPREVLAVAYGIYPRYFDPENSQQIDAQSAVKRFMAV